MIHNSVGEALKRNIMIWYYMSLQVLQEPEAQHLGRRVAGGITQRLAARLLQQVLRDPPAATAPTL